MHHLPVVSRHEKHVLLERLHCFTETGQLWNSMTCSQNLGKKLVLYRWSDPIRILPQDHSQVTEYPHVNFSFFLFFSAFCLLHPMMFYLHLLPLHTISEIMILQLRMRRWQKRKEESREGSVDRLIQELAPNHLTTRVHIALRLRRKGAGTHAKRATTPLGKRSEKFEVGLGRRIRKGSDNKGFLFCFSHSGSVQASADTLINHKLPKFDRGQTESHKTICLVDAYMAATPLELKEWQWFLSAQQNSTSFLPVHRDEITIT